MKKRWLSIKMSDQVKVDTYYKCFYIFIMFFEIINSDNLFFWQKQIEKEKNCLK